MDLHEQPRARTEAASHMATNTRNPAEMACPAATVTSAPAAAIENNRSRRAGTSNECTTWTHTNRPARGTSIELSCPVWAAPNTCSTNSTKTARTPMASTIFTHCHGWRLVAAENTMPAQMATAATRAESIPPERPTTATRAEALESSPTEEQANTPVRTATSVASRNSDECSGACGAFAFRTISKKPVRSPSSPRS